MNQGMEHKYTRKVYLNLTEMHLQQVSHIKAHFSSALYSAVSKQLHRNEQNLLLTPLWRQIEILLCVSCALRSVGLCSDQSSSTLLQFISLTESITVQ